MDWNLTGHEWAAKLLQQHIASGEVRHAYLFTGPPGVGRRTLALRFAQAINCTQPPAPGLACGKCRVCVQMERMQQADLAIVQADQEGAQLAVESIRELQHSLSLSPYESRYRVALLLRFQEATASAQNALLRTLEDAPEKAILLLTADSAEVLLPTIVSRCEVLRLRPLPVEVVQSSLEARGISSSLAQLAAHISGGRPGYAVRLSQNEELLKQRQEFLAELWELLSSNRRQRFARAEKIAKTRGNAPEVREKLRQRILVWLTVWRDVLLRCAGSSSPLTNPDQVEHIDRLAVSVDLAGARLQINALEDCLARLKNANLQLLMEALLLDLPRVNC